MSHDGWLARPPAPHRRTARMVPAVPTILLGNLKDLHKAVRSYILYLININVNNINGSKLKLYEGINY